MHGGKRMKTENGDGVNSQKLVGARRKGARNTTIK